MCRMRTLHARLDDRHDSAPCDGLRGVTRRAASSRHASSGGNDIASFVTTPIVRSSDDVHSSAALDSQLKDFQSKRIEEVSIAVTVDNVSPLLPPTMLICLFRDPK